jgi:hypothetical protein
LPSIGINFSPAKPIQVLGNWWTNTEKYFIWRPYIQERGIVTRARI